MRSTSAYSSPSHSGSYATSSYSSSQSPSSAYVSGRSTASRLPSSAGSYSSKRYSSSSVASGVPSTNGTAYNSSDYATSGSTMTELSSVSGRNGVVRRVSSLASASTDRRNGGVLGAMAEKSAPAAGSWQNKRDARSNNNSLLSPSNVQRVGGTRNSSLDAAFDNGVRRMSFFGDNGDEAAAAAYRTDGNSGADVDRGAGYRKTSLGSNARVENGRGFKTTTTTAVDDYGRSPLRKQSAVTTGNEYPYEASATTASMAQLRGPPRKANSVPNNSAPDQKEFIKRLLQAHNVVDDLLKSRGMNSEDERGYLRFLRKVPEVLEEEESKSIIEPPSPTSKSESDSGLSLDSDSEELPHIEDVMFEIPVEEQTDLETALVSDETSVEFVEFVMMQKGIVSESSSLTTRLRKVSRSVKQSEETMNEKTNKNIEDAPKPEQVESSESKRFARNRIAKRTLDALIKNRPRARSSAQISIQHVSFYQTTRSFAEQKPALVEKVVRIHLRLTQRGQESFRTSITLPQRTRTQHVMLSVRQLCRNVHRTRHLSHSAPQSPPMLRKTIPAHVRKMVTINRVQIPESFLKPLHRTENYTNTIEDRQDTDLSLRAARDKLKRVAFNETIRTSTQIEQSVEHDESQQHAPVAQCQNSRQKGEAKSNVRKPHTTALNAHCSDQLLEKKPQVDLGKLKAETKTAVSVKRQPSGDNVAKPQATVNAPKPSGVGDKNNGIGRELSGSKSVDSVDVKMKKLPNKDNTTKALEEGDNKAKGSDTRIRRRALTSINDADVRKALQNQVHEETDRTLVSEFRRSKVIPVPRAIIRTELPPSAAPAIRVLNVRPVRDFVEPLPPARFLRRRTPERLLLPERTSTSTSSLTRIETATSDKCEREEVTRVVLKPVNRALRPVRQSYTKTAVESSVFRSRNRLGDQQLLSKSPEGLFGVCLKRVDRHRVPHTPRGAVTQTSAKKPWIPKWRRVESSEVEDVHEEEQSDSAANSAVHSPRGRVPKNNELTVKKSDEAEDAKVQKKTLTQD